MVSETLLSNVKVLAVDQRAMGTNPTDANGKLLIPRSVSVMVTPENAQRVRLAQKTGNVTLVLRSLEDRTEDAPLPVTHESDLSQSKGGGSPTALLQESESVLIRRGAPKQNKEQQVITDSLQSGLAPAPRPEGADTVGPDGRAF